MTDTQDPKPTLEQIAEYNASAQSQLADNIVKLINASEIDDANLVARALGNVLIEFIRGIADKEVTFAEAGKHAIQILKHIIKHTKYGIGKNRVIDLETGEEVSPGGFKQ
jgi:hypothetical protein